MNNDFCFLFALFVIPVSMVIYVGFQYWLLFNRPEFALALSRFERTCDLTRPPPRRPSSNRRHPPQESSFPPSRHNQDDDSSWQIKPVV